MLGSDFPQDLGEAVHHLPLSKGSGLPSFEGGYLLDVSAQVSGSCLPHQMQGKVGAWNGMAC